MTGELFKCGEALFGRGQLHQLHLVELVLTDEPANVAAVGAGFGTEAGGVGRIPQRQRRFFQDLVAVQVGHRHFSGGNQEKVLWVDAEKIGFEFREVARSFEHRPADQERRQHFRIPVLLGVQVEHEGDEGAFQPGTSTEVDGETGPRQLGAAFEVEDAELRSKVPVRLGRKAVGAGLADPAHFDVGRLVRPHRHRHIGQVRNPHFEVDELLVDPREAPFELLDPDLHLADFGHLGSGIATRLLDLADLLAGVVAPALQLLHFDQAGAAFAVEFVPAVVGGEVESARFKARPDEIGFAT